MSHKQAWYLDESGLSILEWETRLVQISMLFKELLEAFCSMLFFQS